MRIAFIGAGFVNFGGGEGPWDHASRLEGMPAVEVVGICDPDEPRAAGQLKLRRHGTRPDLYAACHVFTNHRTMLEAAAPDAVIIGLPPSAHGQTRGDNAVEMACAQAGVHMLIEKPLAVGNPEEVNALATHLAQARARDGGGLIVSVGYMLRYHPVVQHLRSMVKTASSDGRPPCVFAARYSAAYPFILSPAFWDGRRSGGPIIEQATHFVDLARYLVGEIDLHSIHAQQIPASSALGALGQMPAGEDGRPLDADVPYAARIARATVAQWRFESGALGTLTHALLQRGKAYDTELEIWCDGLHAVLRDPYSDQCQLLIREGDFRSDVHPLLGHNDPYFAELESFLNAIRCHDPTPVRSPYSDAAKTFHATCQIAQSAMTTEQHGQP